MSHAILWECYVHETRRGGNWPEALAKVWQRVEKDVHVPKILTFPHEPEFEESYTYFLSRLWLCDRSRKPRLVEQGTEGKVIFVLGSLTGAFVSNVEV